MPVPKDFSAPHRISAKDRAFSQLQRWIIDGTLQPGEKLNDGEIAEALGLSRTPVREALQLLAVQGFVEMQPGKVTKVTMIEKSDILQVYPPLAALQALAAEQVAIKIHKEDIDQLRQLNAQFAQAVDQQLPFKAMELDEQFHDLIIEIADNPYITSFTDTLQMHIRRLKYVLLKQPLSSTHVSIDEHEGLIQALEAGDPHLAAEAMKQNWLRPMRELEKLI